MNVQTVSKSSLSSVLFLKISKIYFLYEKVHLTCSGESIGLKFFPSQLELFRFIPISVSEPMRIIPNQSEKLFVSRLMKNGQKSIRLNSNESGPIQN